MFTTVKQFLKNDLFFTVKKLNAIHLLYINCKKIITGNFKHCISIYASLHVRIC